MVRRLRPEATLIAAIFSRLRLRLAQFSHRQMPWQPLTQVAQRDAARLFPVFLSNSTSPFASTCGGLLKQADTGPSDTCAFRVALRAGLQHDQSVGLRRTSTAHRHQPSERPRIDGRHHARLHLLQYAPWLVTLLALLSFKPTRPVSGVSQHRWRRRGSTPRWVPFGECASRHVKRCAAAATARTR